MEYKLDSHTHSIASGHAYSTVAEMAKAASEKGLELLAITEHAAKMPGTCHEMYFMNFKAIPNNLYGVKMLYGVELNIIDYEGKVDMRPKLLDRMGVAIASLHTPCIEPGTVAENTNALIGAMKNPAVSIIGHPDDGRYPIDIDTVVAAAKEEQVLLELNNSSLKPECGRIQTWENDQKLLETCMKYGQPIILDSDAHWADDIGNHSYSECLIRQMDFPMELVVNTSVELYLNSLKQTSGLERQRNSFTLKL